MAVNLASVGFVFAADWYWRIIGDDGAFGASGALACLIPLAKLARGRFALDDIAASADDRVVTLQLRGVPVEIEVGAAPARAAADRFVIALNRHLHAVEHAFALVVPRRYELRGVLLPRGALVDHAADRFIVAPSDRASWRRFARAETPL